MQAFFVAVLIKVLADERIQAWIKNMVTVAAVSAAEAVIKKLPGIDAVGDLADVAADVRNDIDQLIPDFDTGIKPIDDILDFWRR